MTKFEVSREYGSTSEYLPIDALFCYKQLNKEEIIYSAAELLFRYAQQKDSPLIRMKVDKLYGFFVFHRSDIPLIAEELLTFANNLL